MARQLGPHHSGRPWSPAPGTHPGSDALATIAPEEVASPTAPVSPRRCPPASLTAPVSPCCCPRVSGAQCSSGPPRGSWNEASKLHPHVHKGERPTPPVESRPATLGLDSRVGCKGQRAHSNPQEACVSALVPVLCHHEEARLLGRRPTQARPAHPSHARRPAQPRTTPTGEPPTLAAGL